MKIRDVRNQKNEGLPPHLAKFVGDDGDWTPDAKKRLGKDGAERLATTKRKTKDVTPKGYGPVEEDVNSFVKVDKRAFYDLEKQGAHFNPHTGGLYMDDKLIGVRDDVTDQVGDGDRYYYDYLVSPEFAPEREVAEGWHDDKGRYTSTGTTTYLLKDPEGTDWTLFHYKDTPGSNPQHLKRMIDQYTKRLGWSRGEVVAQWQGDIDEVLANAEEKLSSGKEYIHSYKMELQQTVRDLSKAKKVMSAGKEVHPPTTEGRDPRDVINNFLKKKEQRSERGQKLYTDREFQQDMAAVKAGEADPSAMADKWGERGGAFLNFVREAGLGTGMKAFKRIDGENTDPRIIKIKLMLTSPEFIERVAKDPDYKPNLGDKLISKMMKALGFPEIGELQRRIAKKLVASGEYKKAVSPKYNTIAYTNDELRDLYQRYIINGEDPRNDFSLDDVYPQIKRKFASKQISSIGWTDDRNVAVKDIDGNEWVYDPMTQKVSKMSTNEAEVGDKVKYRNIKTKRRKTGTVRKVDTKNGQKRYELDGGKMVYDGDLEEDGRETASAAVKRDNAARQRNINKAKRMMKRGFSAEKAAKEHGVHVQDLQENDVEIAENYLPGLPDAPRRKPTRGHRPAIWEVMLGTVYAMNDAGEIKSFGRNYEEAIAFSGAAEEGRDPRLHKLKNKIRPTQGDETIPAGKLVYWIRKEPMMGESEPTDSDYAIGMAQAKKSTGDKPPLKKSTIKKAHKIARSVAKESTASGKRMPTHEIMDRIERAMPDLKPYGVKEKVLGIVSDILYKADQGLLEDDDPCWKGYRQLGMKKKNGKEVPNCVPESEGVEEGRRFKTAYGWAGGSKEPTKREIEAQRKRAEKRRAEREARSKEQRKVDEAMPSFGKVITVSKGGRAVKQIKMQDGAKMHHLARELRSANLGLRDLDLTNAARELARGKSYSAGDVELTVGEHKPRQFEGASYERGLDPDQTIVVKGVKGMNSKPFRKRFRNEQAFNRWADSEAAGDYEVHQVTNEAAAAEKEGKRCGKCGKNTIVNTKNGWYCSNCDKKPVNEKEGGMSDAERKAYNRKHGSNLKRAQPGGGKRRTSYCARSKGQMDQHNIDCRKDPDKPICKSRRDWNC